LFIPFRFPTPFERREPFRQRRRVTQVIEMPVRDQHRIQAREGVILRVSGIAVRPGVHQEDFAGFQAELKGAVSKPGDFEHE
jgi:hypothetical protein